MLGTLLESAAHFAPASNAIPPVQAAPAEFAYSAGFLSGEILGLAFLIGIGFLVYLALAVGVANEAAAKGYNYWDYFLSSLFGNHWGTRAMLHSLPHKTRLPDKLILDSESKSNRQPARDRSARKHECHACNAPVAPDDGFCGICGTRQRWDEAAQVPSTLGCTSCGASIPATANYCSTCGTAAPKRTHVPA